MSRIRFVAAAEAELESALRYYGERDPAVAGRFLNDVDARLLRAGAFPNSGTARPELGDREVRVFPLARFPFFLVTAIVADERQVIAVMHQRQKPEYWLKRLK